MKRLLFISERSHRIVQTSQGFTLIEALVTIAIIGVLAAMTAPMFSGYNKPLQNATNQVAGVFKQARMRAIATTNAFRITPRADNRGFNVERAIRNGTCGSTALLTQAAVSADTTLRVSTVRGFKIGDQITVGSDSTGNNIIGIDPTTSTFTLGAALGSSQSVSAQVEVLGNWDGIDTTTGKSKDLVTGFTDDDLLLPQPRSSLFGLTQQSPDQEVRLTSSPTSWRLCFNGRGSAFLTDPSTGNPITNQNLFLLLRRFDTATNQNVGAIAGLRVLPGGTINFGYAANLTPDNSSFDSNRIADTSTVKE
jgi:prepilin-type N-terminal cleavage/methylation domain-containing protein